jgi:eukaryotic-like serine/threonine-protein kinase
MKFDFRKYNRNTLGGLLIHLVIVFSFVLILAVLYFYAYLPSTTNHAESITVPNIEGLPVDKVEAFLAKHDLRFEVNDSSYSSQYPPLTVLKQYPSPGARVKENRKVFVSINRLNPPVVPVPDIINTSLINAEAVLKGNELKRGRIHLIRGPFLNLVQELRVGGSKIQPGVKVPKGTVIDLMVMDGGSMYLPTPNVLNSSYEDAKFSLLGSNLNLNVTLVGDTTGLGPIVLKQKPGPNENIKVGDVVELWIGAPDAELPPDDEDQAAQEGETDGN